MKLNIKYDKLSANILEYGGFVSMTAGVITGNSGYIYFGGIAMLSGENMKSRKRLSELEKIVK